MKKLICALAALGGLPIFAQAPDIPYTGTIDFLTLPPNTYMGEAAGVATDSKGNIFVYTRTGESATMGGSRFFTHGGSRLFEFDHGGKFVRGFGTGIYGFLFAQSVRVDPQDNVWAVDRGSNTIMKFDPNGRFLQVLSRKPESVNPLSPPGPGRGSVPGQGIQGDNFNKPTDIAWDSNGNMFVSDGYNSARIVKLDNTGRFIKTWGMKGAGDGQFNMPNSVAVDAQGNVYVADLGNRRIQVFDNDGNFKSQITNVGAPWAVCISPGSHQYLYSSNSNPPDSMDNGEIYKMELDGRIIGRFGGAGKQVKEFGTVNEIDCRDPNTLYVGELTNWRVQRIKLSAK